MTTPSACGHPKIGTCKGCSHKHTMIKCIKDCACRCLTKRWFTQSDIDKYHAEKVMEIAKESDFFKRNRLMTALYRCLNHD